MPKINRAGVKKLLVIQKKIELAAHIIEARKIPEITDLYRLWLNTQKIACLHSQLNAIIRTPAEVFRTDGKVDKRRRRRFIGRHIKGVKVNTRSLRAI